MESQHDIEQTQRAGACAEAVEALKNGMTYEQIYAWRPDWRTWRWAHVDTITPRQAEALASVAPAEFWVRALGASVSWIYANLRGANLSDADLSDANLSDADLSDADLSGADLRGANLSDADLSGADLSNADLSDADLSGADLRGANLSDADLSWADLSVADLSDANRPGNGIAGWAADDDGRLRMIQGERP